MSASATEQRLANFSAGPAVLPVPVLERIRDENLVGIMQVLAKGHGGKGWGAGKLLKDYEADLRARAANDA